MNAFGYPGRGLSLRQLLLTLWYAGAPLERLDFYEHMLRPIEPVGVTVVHVRGPWRSEVVL